MDEDEDEDEDGTHAVVRKELQSTANTRDRLREGALSGSSSEESSSGEEEEEEEEEEGDHIRDEAGLADHLIDDVPVGEASSRLAVVNLDWDNIRVEDLMAVFSSFLPGGGPITQSGDLP